MNENFNTEKKKSIRKEQTEEQPERGIGKCVKRKGETKTDKTEVTGEKKTENRTV